jgi:hypothetical protein
MEEQNDISSEIGGWTISEWYRRSKISCGQNYALPREGNAPKVLRAGKPPPITPQHDPEWAKRKHRARNFR